MSPERYWICAGPGKPQIATTPEQAETARKFGFEVVGPLMVVPTEEQIKDAAQSIEDILDDTRYDYDSLTSAYDVSKRKIELLLGA